MQYLYLIILVKVYKLCIKSDKYYNYVHNKYFNVFNKTDYCFYTFMYTLCFNTCGNYTKYKMLLIIIIKIIGITHDVFLKEAAINLQYL
jgi:hypothetical protein